MVNRARGEVPFVIEGRTYRLCLTLGALAEIESGLGADDLGALERALARPRLAHLMVLLGALLRGGGHDLDERTLAGLQIDLAALGQAIGAAFSAAGMGARETAPVGEASAPPNLPNPANSGGAGSPSVSASWEWQPTNFGD